MTNWNMFSTLLTLGFLTSPLLQCHATGTSTEPKPMIARPPGSKYTIVISADGGTLKASMGAMVLIALEDIIKEHILTETPYLLPNDTFISSTDDFDINLADYIDVFAGSSAGSWGLTYLASRGGNGASKGIFSEKRIIDEYGVITPGSARGLLVLFREFSNEMLPSHLVPETGQPTGADPTEPGVIAPVLNGTGVQSTLQEFLGDTKMSDVSTTLLIPAFDLTTRSMVMFLHDEIIGSKRFGYVNLIHRNESRPLVEPYLADAEVVLGQDFLLRDISQASSAAPIFFPAHNISSVGGQPETFLLSDGVLGILNPTLYAIAHVQNATQQVSVENIAVISLGSGHTFGNYTDNINGGVAQWLASGEYTNVVFLSSADILSNLLDLLFYGNPNVQLGQYLRVQAFGETGTERGRILDRGFDSTEVEDLILIGEELAQTYSASLRAFVKNFIFPE